MTCTARSTLVATAGALSLAAALAGCASLMGAPTATATLSPRSGSSVSGSLRFVEQSGGLRVTGEVRGLTPNAEHGFHVHDKGDCSSADASSAGGHFNPGGMAHGHAGMPPHHAGDMPNLRADGNGVARVDTVVRDLTLSAGKSSVLDRGVVVHRDPDDYRSQPAGNSGARVACGVITRA